MTYQNLLSNVFTGIVITDDVKARDGSIVGFISPILGECAEAVLQWKKDKAFKNAYDGNLPFTQGKFGNKDVRKNTFVEFKIRCNNRGLPEAYEVKLVEAKAEPTPEFKPIEAKPIAVPTIPSNLVDAVSAAYAEMDEDDFVSIDEMEDEDYSLYDDYDPNDGGGPYVRRFNRADER